MSLFLFNWCAFSTLQGTLLIRRQVFIRSAANALNPGVNFIFRLVISEVRLTTLTALAEPEASATQIGSTSRRRRVARLIAIYKLTGGITGCTESPRTAGLRLPNEGQTIEYEI